MRTKKRRRSSMPTMLLWNRRDQARFIEAVEKLVSHVNDLAVQILSLHEQVKQIKLATGSPIPLPAPPRGCTH